jgi:hypothetical protein
MKDISVDYWIFKDDEWYLYEFGKGEWKRTRRLKENNFWEEGNGCI